MFLSVVHILYLPDVCLVLAALSSVPDLCSPDGPDEPGLYWLLACMGAAECFCFFKVR